MTGASSKVLGPARIVLADANVLYSRVLRDYLVYAADEGVIAIRWSRRILTEAMKHLQAHNAAFDDEHARIRPDQRTRWNEPGRASSELSPNGRRARSV